MTDRFEKHLASLKAGGNLRKINEISDKDMLIDLSSNDYLGIANNHQLTKEFFSVCPVDEIMMSSSASRLLSLNQKYHNELENKLSSLYGKSVLLFNSGYHANSGIIPALCVGNTLIVADKLVHASIIDGIILSRAPYVRYRHNDYRHLESIISEKGPGYDNIIIITESVFSMDGDRCDVKRLVDIKKRYKNIMLYIDEAHAFGVLGPKGLGLSAAEDLTGDIDIIIGTFGKAGASVGAFALTSETIREYLINCTRSFIFSTALPPVNCAWTSFLLDKITAMDTERKHLAAISTKLYEFFNVINENIKSSSHIIPWVIGDSKKTITISAELRKLGYIALPIRMPTVPKGTERIRFSLNASLSEEVINKLITDIARFI